MNRKYDRPEVKPFALQPQQLLAASVQGMSGEISGYRQSGSGFSQGESSPLKHQGNPVNWDE